MKSLSVKRFLSPLSLSAFVAGFSLMAFELVAARILAPSIGNSTYVWTSVIGVIMLALSLGYFLGGKMADARKQPIDVAMLFFIAATCVLITLIFSPQILFSIVESGLDSRVQGVLAALVLFAPASLALGMISPYVAKLNITSLETSGQSVAMLSTINSVGSIAGTFIAGFILFSIIGSRETLVVIITLLVVAGWFLATKKKIYLKLMLSAALLLVAAVTLAIRNNHSIDTPTAHYSIVQFERQGRTIRGIMSGPLGVQSGVYTKSPDELAFWYTQQLAHVIAQAPQKQRILILGGGTYTLPRYLAEKYPTSHIDVVEIDPELTEIARKQFFYNDPANVSLHYDDARVFVNHATQKYDVILMDAYSDISMPFSLLTREYGHQIQRILTPQGIVGVNALAADHGSCKPVYDAINATYAPLGSTYYVNIEHPTANRSNLILVYGNQLPAFTGYTANAASHQAAYTDNFTPADAIQQTCQESRT